MFNAAERSFSTNFSYSGITTVESPSDLHAECERLLREHPDWAGDTHLQRIFLVHAPEAGYASDDHGSPYFTVKRLLLEHGIPCQMVDTPTLLNPDYKDLTLSLNVVAKCGLVPWVLPEGIPDADFFVGLSYTQSRDADGQRLMGYANVFNEYGRWLFYSGNTQAFDYSERTMHFGSLDRET